MEALLTLEAYNKLLEQLQQLQELKQKTLLMGDKIKEQELQIEELSKQLTKYKERRKVFCRTCKNKNFHIIMDEQNIPKEEDEEGYPLNFSVEKRLQCLGCYTIVTETYDCDRDGNYLRGPTFSPNNQKWHLIPKAIFEELEDGTVKKTYENMIKCFNQEMNIFCSTAIRILIEAIGMDLGIKQELISQGKNKFNIGIEDMMNYMVEKGIVTKNTSVILKELRFVGNEAVHEMIEHSREELQLAIQIMENIIENIFIITKMNEQRKHISHNRRNPTR